MPRVLKIKNATYIGNDLCRGNRKRVFIGEVFMPRFSNATVRVVMVQILYGIDGFVCWLVLLGKGEVVLCRGN